VKKDSIRVPVVARTAQKNLNTDDYKFEDDAVKTSKPSDSFLSRYMKAKDNSRITGPFPYQPKFSYDNLTTNFVVDPLRGFSIRLETQMNDMLENYRIFGVFKLRLTGKARRLRRVSYLKHRVDFSIRYDRKVIFWTQHNPEIPQKR